MLLVISVIGFQQPFILLVISAIPVILHSHDINPPSPSHRPHTEKHSHIFKITGITSKIKDFRKPITEITSKINDFES